MAKDPARALHVAAELFPTLATKPLGVLVEVRLKGCTVPDLIVNRPLARIRGLVLFGNGVSVVAADVPDGGLEAIERKQLPDVFAQPGAVPGGHVAVNGEIDLVDEHSEKDDCGRDTDRRVPRLGARGSNASPILRLRPIIHGLVV